MPLPPPFSEDNLRVAMQEATCWADVLRWLGYAVKGANYRTVQRWARIWDVSSDHFDPNQARRRALRATAAPLEDVLVEHSSYARGKLKERLFATGLKQPICEMCGLGDIWYGNRMALVLDHINGVSNDHRLENLRIVCPNCAATLDTHCGRNLPRERTCPSCGENFAPRHIRHRYCSRECWNTVAGQHLRGVPQPGRRKVARPTYAQLREDIASMSFLAVGRKYGVSDNAVRKWLRWYEENSECDRPGPPNPGKKLAP